jgi:hypothetical protein
MAQSALPLLLQMGPLRLVPVALASLAALTSDMSANR